MLTKLNKLWRNQRGGDAVEYIIIIALVAICALAGFKDISKKVTTSLTNVNTQLGDAKIETAGQ